MQLASYTWQMQLITFLMLCLPLHGLQETIPRKPSRLTSFMGRLVLDHAVSRRPPAQHSSLVTPLISTMSHLWSWLCCSQHIPAGDGAVTDVNYYRNVYLCYRNTSCYYERLSITLHKSCHKSFVFLKILYHLEHYILHMSGFFNTY